MHTSQAMQPARIREHSSIDGAHFVVARTSWLRLVTPSFA